MGDRITTFMDCPKCGAKGMFECYEAISSLIKSDDCMECGYYISYNVDDSEDVITITQVSEGVRPHSGLPTTPVDTTPTMPSPDLGEGKEK